MDNGISRNFIEINFENEYSFSEVYDEYLSSLSSSTPSSSALPYDCLSSDDQLYSVFNSLPQLAEWSAEDKKLFENAQAEINYLGILGSFQKMSLMVPGKTIEEPKQHYQLFGDKNNPIPVDDNNNNKHVIAPSTATTIIIGICHHNENGSISRKGKETVSDDKNEAPVVPSCRARIKAILSQARHGLRRPSRKGFGAGIKKPNRRTHIRWTEAEHKLFLDGLDKYGKGDWRNIARHYVRTRSPAQVASHSQKHFIRLAKQPQEVLVGNQEGQRTNTDTVNTHMGIGNISLIKENSRSGWSGYGSSSTYPHGANITKSSYISTRGSYRPIWHQQEQVLKPSMANYGMSASSIDQQSYQPAHINRAMRMSNPSNGAERMTINNYLCSNTASTSNHMTSNNIMLNERMTALDDPSNAYILESSNAYML